MAIETAEISDQTADQVSLQTGAYKHRRTIAWFHPLTECALIPIALDLYIKKTN